MKARAGPYGSYDNLTYVRVPPSKSDDITYQVLLSQSMYCDFCNLKFCSESVVGDVVLINHKKKKKKKKKKKIKLITFVGFEMSNVKNRNYFTCKYV